MLCALGIAMLTSLFAHGENIRVLVVYDQGGWDKVMNHQQKAQALINNANDALIHSGFSGYSYDLSVYLNGPVNFNSATTTSTQEIKIFMQQVSALPDSIWTLRYQ